MITPMISSITAAPITIWAIPVCSLCISFNTLRVIPILVAVNVPPINREIPTDKSKR